MDGVTLTPWPAVTLVAWVVLLAAGAFVVATARTWKGTGRRYRTDARDRGSVGIRLGVRLGIRRRPPASARLRWMRSTHGTASREAKIPHAERPR